MWIPSNYSTESETTHKKKTWRSEIYCDKCKYAATQDGNLKLHIEWKLEGVRCSCDKCEYAATTAGNLKKQIEMKHEG